MRLLNTKTLKLEHFIGQATKKTLVRKEGDDVADSSVPRYAILSHTWGVGEVLFEDMQGDHTVAEARYGYKKLKASCGRALKDGFDYIWIDTCCIDKASSAELSEAINSMFKWYKNSSLCYVYLEDVFGSMPTTTTDILGQTPRWYGRGWTLQELIAPTTIHFYSSEWKYLGSKDEHLEAVAEVTGIDIYALNGGSLARMSIARRMSWIARRKTTRAEDMAYCMLGIFDISMPLLYGEGDKAFIRLQEEIMKGTDDQSLFAWREDDSMDYYREDYGDRWERNGLLAPSPQFFASSAKVSRFQRPRHERPQSIVTSQSLTVSFLMCRDTGYQSGEVYLAVLDCQIGRTPGVFAGIRLRRVSVVGDEFVRLDIPQVFRFARCNDGGEVKVGGFDPTREQARLVELKLRTIHRDWKPRTIHVSQSPLPPLPPAFWIISSTSISAGELFVTAAHPRSMWDDESWTMQPSVATTFTSKLGALELLFGRKRYYLIFGVASTQEGMEPWCMLEQRNGNLTLEQFFNHFKVDVGIVGEEGGKVGQKKGEFNGTSHWDTVEATALSSSVWRQDVSGNEMFIVRVAEV